MAKHPRHVKTAPSLFSSTVVPEISCVYAATVPLPFRLGTFVRAAQRFINERLAPVWGVEARLRVRPRTRDGAWALVFVDTEDQASADGWHDLTERGMPLAKVFLRVLAKETRENSTEKEFPAAFRDAITLTATHEIAEIARRSRGHAVRPAPGLRSLWPRGRRSLRRRRIPHRWLPDDRLRVSHLVRGLSRARLDEVR